MPVSKGDGVSVIKKTNSKSLVTTVRMFTVSAAFISASIRQNIELIRLDTFVLVWDAARFLAFCGAQQQVFMNKLEIVQQKSAIHTYLQLYLQLLFTVSHILDIITQLCACNHHMWPIMYRKKKGKFITELSCFHTLKSWIHLFVQIGTITHMYFSWLKEQDYDSNNQIRQSAIHQSGGFSFF